MKSLKLIVLSVMMLGTDVVFAKCGACGKKPKRGHSSVMQQMAEDAQYLRHAMSKVACEWPAGAEAMTPGTQDLVTRACCVTKILKDILECCDEVRECAELLKEEVEECCEGLEQDFRDTWTQLDALSEQLEDCCDAQAECCEELCRKFQETWTILAEDNGLGSPSDAGSRCCDFADPDDVDAATLSVFEWLKTIYIEARRGNQGEGIECGDSAADPWNDCV